MHTSLLILISAVGLVAFEGADGQTAPQQPPAPAAQSASSSAAASTSAQGGSVGRQPEVVIRAQLAPKVSAFVNQLTGFDPGDLAVGLARWQQSACPSVSGVSREQGEFILGRISEIAREARVPLAGENCRSNLYVMVTSDPVKLLRGMEKRNRIYTFGDAVEPVIDHFITTPRPVRVWYHSIEKTPEGLPLLSMVFPEMEHGEMGTGFQNGDTGVYKAGGGSVSFDPMMSQEKVGTDSGHGSNNWSHASHLQLNVVWSIYRVFIIVDGTKLNGASVGQIADYAAMVGLAEVRPGARLGDAPTILRLFEQTPQAASDGLTDWDQAFLKELYGTEQKLKLQRSEIAVDMVRDISH
jgi:hypothetical protein